MYTDTHTQTLRERAKTSEEELGQARDAGEALERSLEDARETARRAHVRETQALAGDVADEAVRRWCGGEEENNDAVGDGGIVACSRPVGVAGSVAGFATEMAAASASLDQDSVPDAVRAKHNGEIAALKWRIKTIRAASGRQKEETDKILAQNQQVTQKLQARSVAIEMGMERARTEGEALGRSLEDAHEAARLARAREVQAVADGEAAMNKCMAAYGDNDVLRASSSSTVIVVNEETTVEERRTLEERVALLQRQAAAVVTVTVTTAAAATAMATGEAAMGEEKHSAESAALREMFTQQQRRFEGQVRLLETSRQDVEERLKLARSTVDAKNEEIKDLAQLANLMLPARGRDGRGGRSNKTGEGEGKRSFRERGVDGVADRRRIDVQAALGAFL